MESHWNKRQLDWLIEGRDRFALEGLIGLEVVGLSEAVGIAKSSFYHFFKSKDAFFEELLEYWIFDGTLRVIRLVEKVKDPLEKLQALTALALNNSAHDLFQYQLSAVAPTNALALNYLNKMEAMRMKFVVDIFLDAGFEKKEAKIKATSAYIFINGAMHFYKHRKVNKTELAQVISDLKNITGFE